MKMGKKLSKLVNLSEEKNQLTLLAQLFIDVAREQPEVFENLRELFDQND